MYRALPRSNHHHVLPRHEQGAGFMADGYARSTGKRGCASPSPGPGLTNILTPMGQAYSDSVPMLVLSSALDIGDAARGAAACTRWRASAAPPSRSPAPR